MNRSPSNKVAVTTTLTKDSLQQPNPLFICRYDQTFSYMTFAIKDNDVNITKHCTNSDHTTTEVYNSLKIKSKPQPKIIPEKGNNLVDQGNDKSIRSCEHDREYQCRGGVKSKHRLFPNENKPREEDQLIKVDYFCTQHSTLKLSFHCNTCQTRICSRCKGETHHKHDTFNICTLMERLNIVEIMANMPLGEKGFYEDALQKYTGAIKQLNYAYERYIKINADLFGIVKSCFSMFELYKESYNMNLYRNTANIANNFNILFLKGLGNNTNQNTITFNFASIIEYFSTQLILNVNNIQFPNPSSFTTPSLRQSTQSQQNQPQKVKPKDTPFESVTRIEATGNVYSVCKLNDSQFAVGCGYPDDIYIVDVNTLEILRTLKHHTDCVWRLYFHKKSGNLLSLSIDSSICIWEYSSGKLKKEIKEHNRSVHSVVEGNNGDIVTVCGGGLIKYWNMTEYKCYRTIEDGSYLYDVLLKDNKGITGGNCGIKVYEEDAKSKHDYSYRNECNGNIVSSLGGKNNGGLAGCDNGCILIYDSITFDGQGKLTGHSGYVNSLIVLGNGGVATGGIDYLLKIWDGDAKECKQTLKLGGSFFTGGCEWDGNSVICGTWDDKAIKIFARK